MEAFSTLQCNGSLTSQHRLKNYWFSVFTNNHRNNQAVKKRS